MRADDEPGLRIRFDPKPAPKPLAPLAGDTFRQTERSNGYAPARLSRAGTRMRPPSTSKGGRFGRSLFIRQLFAFFDHRILGVSRV